MTRCLSLAPFASALLLLFTLTACGPDNSNRPRPLPTDNDGQQQNQADNQQHNQNSEEPQLPALTDLQGPEAFTDQNEATFTFGCSQQDCTFTCQLDDGLLETCESGITYADLSEGEHTFTVQATNAEGLQSPPASWEWTIDTISPLVVGLNGPTDPTGQTDATFTFWCSQPDCEFRCQLERAPDQSIHPFKPCANEESYTDLEDGRYTFSIYASTPEADGPTITWEWTVDSEAPEITLTSTPSQLSNSAESTFSFDCSKPDCTFACTLFDDTTDTLLDGPTDCPEAITYQDLSDGDYLISIVATDLLGNESLPLTYTWTIDQTPPDLFLAVTHNEDEAQATFSCSPNGTACQDFSCFLQPPGQPFDPDAFEPCTSPLTLEDLGSGEQTLHVRVTDEADNLAESSFTWTATQIIWEHVDGGFAHTCGLQHDGSLWCWGRGLFGVLGQNDTDNRDVPTPLDLQGWTAFSTGNNHTCGIRNGGELYCWGDNTYGRLGVGDQENRLVPTRVGTASDWSTVNAAYSHTCGIRNDGELYCWGYGLSHRLGLGSQQDQLTPQQVGTDSNWTSVQGGFAHTCARRTDGTLWCWGSNSSGQLGTGTFNPSTTPTQVGTDSDWTTLAIGTGSTTCALKANGNLYCWGNGDEGRLGTGNQTNQPSPTRIGTALDWATLAVGNSNGCATTTSGDLHCWGYGHHGTNGNASTSDQLSPAPVHGGLDAWESIGLGIHACGLRAGGKLYCWGWNSNSQLGLGHEDDALIPTRVYLD